MSIPDLFFIESARRMEVEAVEGGRSLHEFTLDPQTSKNDEEQPVLGKSVDDAEETEEQIGLIRQYIEFARAAFHQRGLVYPFQPSDSRITLEVVQTQRRIAQRAAELSSMVGHKNPTAKSFETSGFRALQTLVGGWGTCVGSPRNNGFGAERAIRDFRDRLLPWERGDKWPADFAKNGDHGADGFLVLGRGWGGPLVFYQAKNTNLDLQDHPEEFARIPEVLTDWFGKRFSDHRRVLRVLAVNTVLTQDLKDRISEIRGDAAVHILDAVDILCAEFCPQDHSARQYECIVL